MTIKALIKLEWSKFKSNNVFRAVIVLFFILCPWVILTIRNTFKDAPPPFPSTQTIFEFPTIWDYQGYVGNWTIPFLLGFLVIYIFTSEVGNKTMRQNIIIGLTRHEFFMSKFLTILILSILSTLVYIISTLLIGLIYTDGVDSGLVFDSNYAPIRYFLLNIGYMSFALLLSILIRKGTLTILLYFIYIIMLEPILMLVHVYFFTNSSRNYWPINSMEDLMPNPLFRLPNFIKNNDWDFELLLSYPTAMVMTVLYTSLFLFLSYNVFMRKDVVVVFSKSHKL